ncbi:MAG: AlpA family transcriptional regulator [Sediminimonas sp.]|uniref:helix-turn-helix transcriptional regulator n=1 Tax=Sediminimonas sp. TaxID=2823379 RepID=UPI0028709C03|nr:AlpA family phage regulatory protein [Sediminimonas sp.]MDR9484943.1 AlpA family transcriptional regulator [Sediminimonas sp.]
MNHEDSPHDVLLPINAVCEIVARSKASIYRDIKRGTFPAPQKQGGSSRWRRSLIMKVVAGKYPA